MDPHRDVCLEYLSPQNLDTKGLKKHVYISGREFAQHVRILKVDSQHQKNK